MNKSLYQDAKPIFDAASELAAAEREAYIAHACGDRDDLRQLVAQLLHACDETIDRGAAVGRAIERSILSDEAPGAQIDRFVLLDELGEGGFGTVWRAQQSEPVRREVALKVLKAGMDTRKVVARFEIERQALALMDHPSIAQVYDGGVTPSGRPYFAMERVDGVPVKQFCRERDLSLRQRLDLFVRVCNAIQHAHQKGVIHRDIKPANVLVTELEGEAFPKVIDFGIAKAIAEDTSEATRLTGQQQMIGTPEYMAPEQLDGEGVDTRVDVYALGVLLYEMLTGTRPFEQGRLDGGLPSLLDAIRSIEPEKPSTRVATESREQPRSRTTTRLGAALRGDLDWILLRALAKERTRRYGTVAALADDVGRYLRKEPVSAGPPSASYRLSKFVARNRAAIVAASLVAASLVVGLLATGVALGWALQERDRADARFELALDAVREYHTGVARDVMLQQPELASLRSRLLEPPRRFYEQLQESLSADGGVDERYALGRAVQGLGNVQNDVGDGAAAIESYRRAAALLASLVPDASDAADLRHQRAEILGQVGRLLLLEGRVEEGIESLRLSIEQARTLVAAHPDRPEYEDHLADATAELGSAHRQDGDLERADRRWREALGIYQRMREAGRRRSLVTKDIADIHNSMGRVALNSARAQEAREHFANGLGLVEGLFEQRPDFDLMTRIATCAGNLGNACSQLADHEAARAAYQRAIALGSKVHRRLPGIAAHRFSLGNHHSAMASTMAALDRTEDARYHHRRALELLDAARSAADRRLLAQALANGAGFLLDLEDVDGAVERFERAVAVYEALLDATPDPDVASSAASCFNNFASVLRHRSDETAAIELYERSVALRETVLQAYPDNPEQHLNLCSALANLARLHFDAKRYEQAIPHYSRSIEVSEALSNRADRRPEGRWWKLHRGAYWGRANARQMSDRYRKSVADWLRAAQIDAGRMRAPYLTQLFADMVRGGLVVDPAADVRKVVTGSGAVPMDLMRVASAFLRGPGNEPFLPIALALGELAVARVEQDEPAEVWRYLDLLSDAQLQNGDVESAFATQTRAQERAPKDLDERFRRILDGRMREIRAARGR